MADYEHTMKASTTEEPITKKPKTPCDEWREWREKCFAEIEVDPKMSPESRQVCRNFMFFIEFWAFFGEGWDRDPWRPLGYLMIPFTSPIMLVGALYYAWKFDRVGTPSPSKD